MQAESLQQRFADALQAFVDQVKADRSILAAILCGSLSHDRVWEQSDIDVVLVTIDDKKVERAGIALDVNGVNLHATLVPRAEFRRAAEGLLRHSFFHSLLAKGRLLYSHDPSLVGLCDELRVLGDRDAKIQLLKAGIHAIVSLAKARKWFVTRGDLNYTSLWLLYAATPLAQIEVISAGQLVDREVILRAAKLNPPFFDLLYTGLLSGKKTPTRIRQALDAVARYLEEREDRLFSSIFEHLREVGEARSCSEIEDHFERHLGVENVGAACEYLATRGRIGRASLPVRLTKRSQVDLQELAFFSL